MYLHRTLEKILPSVSANFKGILLSGMRQVGKSTLLQHLGQDRKYLTLDQPQVREAAMKTPNRVFELYKPPLTIDEVQWAPDLFPAIKLFLDSTNDCGQVWLSGSQRLSLWAQVADKLPGRIVSLDLLPLSIYEIAGRGLEQEPFVPSFKIASILENRSPEETWDIIFKGGWPKALDYDSLNRGIFFNSLVDNYIAKDVVQLDTFEKRLDFRRFLKTLAARSGQVLNYTSLAQDCGLSQVTVREWLSIAEAGGYIYLLAPYYANIGKRLTKSPKLYFADTGLLCSLMEFQNADEAKRYYGSGAIFETFVVMEILKSWVHNGRRADFYYYRDSDQNEVDLLIHSGGRYYPVEIKSTTAPKGSMLKGIQAFRKNQPDCATAAVISLASEPTAFDDDTVGHSIWSI